MSATIAAPDDAAIARAVTALGAGQLVAFPTETVYGLGADATDDKAVAAIFAAKGRPKFNPLIVHLPDADAAFALVMADSRAKMLAQKFWPGPLTLVLPRRAESTVSLLASAGLDTLAVRVPDHPVALTLLRAVARPIAAPSANISGAVSPTTAAHVAEGLSGAVAMILDGGPCRVGLESTVLDLSGREPVLLRPGGVTRDAIEALIGRVTMTDDSDEAAPRSPGRLAVHYAPKLPLRMGAREAGLGEAREARPGEALLGFGDVPGATMSLSARGDLVEAAANLFAMLRALDAPPHTGIAVAPIPETGLGLAINDRLRRAARKNRSPAGR